MKVFLLTSFICFTFFGSYAQSQKVAVKEKTGRSVYNAVEEQPEPVGGFDKLFGMISKKLKIPTACSPYTSRLAISFIVEADGKIDGYVVIKDACGGKHLLADELFRVVNMVKWTPGKMNGKPVATRYHLPIACLMPSYD